MDLEQRVKILEEELQILKSQIQATLLDIQEQLLSNANPSLRAENNPDQMPSNVSSVKMAPVRTFTPQPEITPNDEREEPAKALPVRAVNLNAAKPKPELAPTPTEPVRQARPTRPSRPQDEYETIVAKPAVKQPRPAAAKPPAAPPTNLPPSMEIDWTAMAELEGWASDQVTRYGAKRTRELIRQFAHEGRFSRTVRDDLLQLVTTYEEVIHDRHEREERAQAVAAAMITPEIAVSASTPTPQSKTEAKEQAEGGVQTVLRLIAGINNAGAGIQWRKRNG